MKNGLTTPATLGAALILAAAGASESSIPPGFASLVLMGDPDAGLAAVPTPAL